MFQMKKLVGLLIALLFLTGSMQAQEKTLTEKKKDKMNVEQMATLQAKKMSLSYDLDKSQQSKIQKLFLEQAKKRETMRTAHQKIRQEDTTINSDKRFELMNDRLDHQIEMKAKMKDILTEEQFEKWNVQNRAKEKGRTRAKRGQLAQKRRALSRRHDGPTKGRSPRRQLRNR
jgi:hypothetical protein